MTAMRALSEFVAETSIADLPADVVARGSLILADCVGCMVCRQRGTRKATAGGTGGGSRQTLRYRAR
jgi:hypothetical protein